jgi:hypothetical protein
MERDKVILVDIIKELAGLQPDFKNFDQWREKLVNDLKKQVNELFLQFVEEGKPEQAFV